MGQIRVFLTCLSVLAVTACGTDGETAGTRRIVVLTPDDATEIVVPADAFDEPITTVVTTTGSATTAQPEPPTTAAPSSTTAEVDGSPASTTTRAGSSTAVTPSNTVATPNSTMSTTTLTTTSTTTTSTTTTSTTTTSTTTTSTTTTTTQPPKETIPIEEEEVNPGIKLMDSLDGFNSCLSSEGWSFIGIPNQEAGPEDPSNNPQYIQALILCNSRTGVGEAFQEFQASRSEMDPDEIREQNEQTIRLGDCLRGKGWSVGELTPNEDGLLNPTEFQSPDGDIDTNDIRDCISELGLLDEDE